MKKRVLTDELTAAIYGCVDDEYPLETWLRRNKEMFDHLMTQQELSEEGEAADPADIIEHMFDGDE